MTDIKRKFFLLLILSFFATVLSGCEFTFLPNSDPIEISGYVTHESLALENVKIVSDFYEYATTNSEGYYSFTTRSKSLVFYAKKTGFNFTPKVYDIKTPQTFYNFEAQEAKNLDGTLTLSQILVIPTSIVSIPGSNYLYNSENGLASLKLHSFNLAINQSFNLEITSETSQLAYLEKNNFNNILKNENLYQYLVEDGNANLNFEFALKAFYKLSGSFEEISMERNIIYKTNAKLDTGDLDTNSSIKFSIPSINSHTNHFTYNLQFVFKYTQN